MAAQRPPKHPTDGRGPRGSAGGRVPGARALAARAGGAALAPALTALAGVAARAGALGRRALATATGETGQRLARAVALTVALAVLVGALYDRGEAPSAAAQPALGAPAGPGPVDGAGAGGRGAAGRRADPGGLRGRARPSPVGERPAAVAAAWYATRNGVPRAKVKPLQQDRLSAREVRVLVLADLGHGRLRTALVRVRRGPDGWSVR